MDRSVDRLSWPKTGSYDVDGLGVLYNLAKEFSSEVISIPDSYSVFQKIVPSTVTPEKFTSRPLGTSLNLSKPLLLLPYQPIYSILQHFERHGRTGLQTSFFHHPGWRPPRLEPPPMLQRSQSSVETLMSGGSSTLARICPTPSSLKLLGACASPTRPPLMFLIHPSRMLQDALYRRRRRCWEWTPLRALRCNFPDERPHRTCAEPSCTTLVRLPSSSPAATHRAASCRQALEAFNAWGQQPRARPDCFSKQPQGQWAQPRCATFVPIPVPLGHALPRSLCLQFMASSPVHSWWRKDTLATTACACAHEQQPHWAARTWAKCCCHRRCCTTCQEKCRRCSCRSPCSGRVYAGACPSLCSPISIRSHWLQFDPETCLLLTTGWG